MSIATKIVDPNGHDQGNFKLYEALSEFLVQKSQGHQVEWTDLYFCDFEGWQFVPENFIIFPHTTVPLNIFEPRYVEMINDSLKNNKIIQATL